MGNRPVLTNVRCLVRAAAICGAVTDLEAVVLWTSFRTAVLCLLDGDGSHKTKVAKCSLLAY